MNTQVVHYLQLHTLFFNLKEVDVHGYLDRLCVTYTFMYVDFSIQFIWDHNLKASSQDHMTLVLAS